MSNNQTKESIFLAQSQPVDVGLAVMEWGAWKFLALTTAVFSYNLFDSILSNNLSGTALLAGRITGVFLLYFVIDAGLTKLLRFVFRQDKKEMTGPMKVFHDFAVLLLVVKVVATMTTSLWAAPEVSEALTDKGKQDEYVAKLLATDSLHRVRELEASSTLSKLEDSKAKRTKEAKAEGAQLVANAVATGNSWQRDSYKREGMGWLTNPANPDASDKQYAQRIQSAKKKAEALLVSVDAKTTEAKGTLTNIRQDTAYARTNALLTELAKKEGAAYDARLQRRTRFFWIFDVLAAALGTMATYLRTKRLQVGGKEEPAKNVAATLSKAMDKWQLGFINWLESLFGIDINGDGSIGGSQDPQNLVATSSHSPQPTAHNPDRVIVAGFQPQQPTSPPPPVGNTPVGVVATTPTANSPQPTAHSPQVISSTEIVDDIEREVIAQLDRFGKYYPSKWNLRGKGGGKPETIATNLADCLKVIERLLDSPGAALTPKTANRYANCQHEFLTNVAPHVQNQQS